MNDAVASGLNKYPNRKNDFERNFMIIIIRWTVKGQRFAGITYLCSEKNYGRSIADS